MTQSQDGKHSVVRLGDGGNDRNINSHLGQTGDNARSNSDGTSLRHFKKLIRKNKSSRLAIETLESIKINVKHNKIKAAVEGAAGLNQILVGLSDIERHEVEFVVASQMMQFAWSKNFGVAARLAAVAADYVFQHKGRYSAAVAAINCLSAAHSEQWDQLSMLPTIDKHWPARAKIARDTVEILAGWRSTSKKTLTVEDLVTLQGAPPVLMADAMACTVSLTGSSGTINIGILTAGSDQSLRRLARQLANEGYKDARNVANSIRNSRRRSVALLEVARRFYKNAQYSDALAILDNRSNHYEILRYDYIIARARCYGGLGRRDEMIFDLQQVHNENNLNVEAFTLLRRAGEVISVGDDVYAMDIARSSPNAAVAIAKMLVEEGRIRLAQEILEMSYGEADDTTRDILAFELGLISELLGNYSDALDRYKSLTYMSKNVGCYVAQARCCCELLKLEEAKDLMQMASDSGLGDQRFNPVRMHLWQLKGDLVKAYGQLRNRRFRNDLEQIFGDRYLPLNKPLIEVNPVCSALVVSEGGPGDELRHASLYEDLNRLFNKLTITCDPRLKSLLERSFPDVQFLPVRRHRKEIMASERGDQSKVPSDELRNFVDNSVIEKSHECDLVFSIMDSLSDLRPNKLAFPSRSKYISPCAVLVDQWSKVISAKSEGRSNVAVSWRSLLLNAQRDRNYLDCEDLSPMLSDTDNVYWIIQPGLTSNEWSYLKGHHPLLNLAEPLDVKDDIEGQAAFLACMDACVAPCNIIAELAPAVGTPTVIFSNSAATAWRRGASGVDTWHNNSVVVVGEPLGSRLGLIDSIRHELKMLIGS